MITWSTFIQPVGGSVAKCYFYLCRVKVFEDNKVPEQFLVDKNNSEESVLACYGPCNFWSRKN